MTRQSRTEISPDNLILNGEGMLKLIDFSVARQVETNVTGSVVGKPNYMAPETVSEANRFQK